MVQSPSSEANWFAASQEIPRISRNPKVHYRTHKRPHLWMFLNISVLQGRVVSTSPNPQAGPRLLSATAYSNLFAATLLIGGRSSIRNLRTRHVVMTGTHYMACSRTGYKNVPLTNLNKCLYSYTSETELNINIGVNDSSEKCLRIFVIYFSYFRQTDAEYIKLCHNHFLLNRFQYIIHGSFCLWRLQAL